MPYTGDYRIDAVGAAGGYDTHANSSQYRGRGARMIGTFSLCKGEIIQILVGQEGGINNYRYGSGGGGGTFVVRGSNTPLIIAGGGGGIDMVSSRHAGCDASTSTTGNPGYKSWSGGSNGHGAQTADDGTSGKIILCNQFQFSTTSFYWNLIVELITESNVKHCILLVSNNNNNNNNNNISEAPFPKGSKALFTRLTRLMF